MGRPRKHNRTEEDFHKRREQTRQWKLKYPEKVLLAGRRYELRKKYNLSYEDYEKMVEEQEGRCALCGESKQLVVDHCHETLKIRKLLCRMCNTGLGMFKDKPEILHKAIGYLET